MASDEPIPLNGAVLDEVKHFLDEEESKFITSGQGRNGGGRHNFAIESQKQGYAILKRIVSFCQSHTDLVMKTDLEDQKTRSAKDTSVVRSLSERGVRGPPEPESATSKELPSPCLRDGQMQQLRGEKFQLEQQVSTLQKQVKRLFAISKELHLLYGKAQDMLQVQSKCLKTFGSKLGINLQLEAASSSPGNKVILHPIRGKADQELSAITDTYRELSFVEARRVKDTLVKPPDIEPETWKIFKHNLIANVFKVSFTQLRKVRMEMLKSLKRCLCQPVCNVKGCFNKEPPKHHSEIDASLPGEIDQVLHQYLRRMNSELHTGCLVEDVIQCSFEEVLQKMPEFIMDGTIKQQDREELRSITTSNNNKRSGANHIVLQDFVESVCQLCWKMAIQQPPVSLKVPVTGEQYRDNIAQEFEALPPPGIAQMRQDQPLRVLYALEPCLMHDDHVLVKGRVNVTISFLPNGMDA